MGTRNVRRAILMLFVCSLAAAAMALTVTVARANDSHMGETGGTVYPVRSTDIRMEAEAVQAVCFGDFAEYRVDFRFVNDGGRRRVLLGFPFVGDQNQGPVGFQAWLDGRPLRVRHVSARPRDWATKSYYLQRATLRHGVTVITVSYLCEPSGSARGRDPDVRASDPGFGMENHYEYWLHTGSTWKGTIGEAVVCYRLADSFDGTGVELAAAEADEGVPVTSPGWTTPLPATYQWRFADFEPTPSESEGWWATSPYDIVLGFGDPLTRRATSAKWTFSSRVRHGRSRWDIQDGSLRSGWLEDVPGAGAGEWVEARFKRPTHLRELRILPGNHEYSGAFAQFGRPKTVTAVFSDGSSVKLRFDDAPALQRFPVDVTTSSVRLTLEAAYEGADYPATGIAEVEFGTEEAPRYAPFEALLADPSAKGSLPAWGGRPAKPPVVTGQGVSWMYTEATAERYACGDLIGVDPWTPFPADEAPFKEPSSPETISAVRSSVLLPDGELVGEVTEVSALSDWTYEIRYASGIDLLVNTDLSRVPSRSVAAELAAEGRDYGPVYRDGRKLPFEVRNVGDQAVGVAAPGEVLCDSSECAEEGVRIPGQVFWRGRRVAYHLFARGEDVSVDRLIEVARSLIEPAPAVEPVATLSPAPATATGAGSWPLWVVIAVATLIVAAVLAVIFVPRRQVPDEASASGTGGPDATEGGSGG